MNAIQKLMVLHPEATITIRGGQNSQASILIEGKIKDGVLNNEDYSLGQKVDLKLESLNSLLTTQLELALERLEGCRCLTPGQDDGQTTCWKHHDCRDGSCTHGE